MATSEDKERMAKAIRELEMKNPTPAPIKSPLLNGKWELAYTTSKYVLGYGRPEITRPTGPIYQTIGDQYIIFVVGVGSCLMDRYGIAESKERGDLAVIQFGKLD